MVGIYCRTSKDILDGTSIEQQREIGIQFCKLNSFEYQVYEDEGKSGFKLSDDEDDPFKNRPAFNKLINDIKKGTIDKLWVYEHSRISRNVTTSGIIFSLFEKYNVRVYEKNNELNLKDNTSEFLRNILDATSMYERNLIVERTTRGLYNAINKGLRAHRHFYGYEKIGKNISGRLIVKPVVSEIEKIKYAYNRYIEGSTLRQITYELIDTNQMSDKDKRNLATKWGRFLRHFEYTGNIFNIEALKILHKYDNYEIDNINILNNEKYYTKSQVYTESLVSINDWFKCAERLHINRLSKKVLKDNNKKASKDLGTGIIKCPECGFRYYAYLTRYSYNGVNKYYNYYKHHAMLNNTLCPQKPKTIQVEKVDEIFKLFYFFNFIVFDNTKKLIKESQNKNKLQQLDIKRSVNTLANTITKIEKQISKFNIALDETENTEDIKVLAHRITENEELLKKHNEELIRLRTNIETLNLKFQNDEITMTYYDVKDRVINWFTKMNLEEQRTELLKVIKDCNIYNHYLIIDNGNIVFLFDTNAVYHFDYSLLDNLDKDVIYKSHFIEMKGKREARKYSGNLIHNVNLERDKEIKIKVFEYLAQTYNIYYNFVGKTNLVSFVHLTGLMSIELDYFKNENTK